jgi:DNA-binding transcriptional ArsR family regulator
MPLFRSHALVRLLAYLFNTEADRPATLSEIAGRLGIAPSTVQRDIDQLEQAGIVRTTRVGRSRLVELDESSSYLPDLRSLFDKAFGPREVLSDLFAQVQGIQEAYIFGSWANRYSGEPGSAPEDLDVLIVGNPKPHAIYRACEEASKLTGLSVEPTLVSPAEWDSSKSGFLRTLRQRPLIPLHSGSDDVLPERPGPQTNTRFVLPHPDGGWIVTKEGRRRASAFARTKDEAVRRAREIVQNAGGGEIRIAGRDGRITDSDTVRPRRARSKA